MNKAILIVMTGFIMFTSCKTPDLALKENEWRSAERLDVKGRQGWTFNEKLSFGDYRTVTLKRSWTKGSGAFAGWTVYKPGYNEVEKLVGIDYSQRKQSVRFELTDAKQQESAVFCVTKVKSANFVISNNPNSVVNKVSDVLEIGDDWQNGYWVNIYLKNNERPWEMVIDNNDAQRQRKNYTGFLALDRNTYYTIKPVYSINNKKGKSVNTIAGSVGFEFRNQDGKPVAAVSLMDQGIVYLDKVSDEERFLLANACAALLLQQQI
ncbi:MAG TPA: hypothetical protein VK166_03940 [Chitinophagaceae bacterium]|nr:hypothetical protein [Chitinophagaceae bacterium]